MAMFNKKNTIIDNRLFITSAAFFSLRNPRNTVNTHFYVVIIHRTCSSNILFLPRPKLNFGYRNSKKQIRLLLHFFSPSEFTVVKPQSTSMYLQERLAGGGELNNYQIELSKTRTGESESKSVGSS